MQTWKLKQKPRKVEQKMWKPRAIAALAILATLALGFFDFPVAWNRGAEFVEAKTGWLPPTLVNEPFRLGLDLQGGTHLVYEADMSHIPEEDRLTALEGVRDVIERRVNAFGVSEPVVQTTSTGGTYRVVIELAGVLNVSEAIALIGETPVLEFKEPGEQLDRDPTSDELARLDELNVRERADAQAVLDRALAGEDFDALVAEFSIDRNKEVHKGIIENITADSYFMEYVLLIQERGIRPGHVNGNLLENEDGVSVFKYLNSSQTEDGTPAYTIQRILMPFSDVSDVVPQTDPWVNTALSGKDLERAAVEFDPNSGTPYVALTFNAQGGDLFGALTQSHVGEPIAIFLDGEAISTPIVQQAIFGGRAVITGDFTIEEAKLLAQRLNAGALPVAVNLLSQQTVGPTLGAVSLEQSIRAALMGFLLVAVYMTAFYRLPGFISAVALVLFAFLNLAAYRLFGVTVTLAGIAGFVLSLGIAVDANVLIIERFKEEYAAGRDFVSATDEAFKRAWTAIRDGNLTTLIAAAVLYWFSSSFIRGFALTLAIGVCLSMFTAITVSRVYLKTALLWKGLRRPSLFGVKRLDV